MRSRFVCTRSTRITVFGAMLALGAMIGVIHAQDRPRLGADELDQSRGTNPNNVLTQTSCNVLNGNAPCAVIGVSCVLCVTDRYTDVTAGTHGGYTTGTGTSSCGNNLAGTCVGFGFSGCATTTPVGVCASPPNVVIQ